MSTIINQAPPTVPPVSPPPVAKPVDSNRGKVPAPSGAFQGIAWFAFVLGALSYLYAAWYTPGSDTTTKYFLYTAFLFSIFGALSVSKVVRDKEEKIPVTGLYYGLSFVAALAPFVIGGYYLAVDALAIPVTNRGLIGMAFVVATFATITIAKNERDKQCLKK